MGALTASTRNRAELEPAGTISNEDVEGLRAELARTIINEVDALRTDVEGLRAELARTISNEVDALKIEVEGLRAELEPAAPEVIALRTRFQTLLEDASNAVSALKTEVEVNAGPHVASVTPAVEMLARMLGGMTPSGEIEILNRQVEMLQEIRDCAIAQAVAVRKSVIRISDGGLVFLPLTIVERCSVVR